jgi:serine/threonine protein kinase
MDHLEGTTLADLLSNNGALSFSRALPLLVQACLALQHAHSKGIIHRDFKSSNLVICLEDGKEVVKVVDFGMAKLLSGDVESRPRQELTQAGDVFGSPLYMSPEQCKGQKLDQRSDIYSLGCVMYYALSGKPPIIGDNLLDTLHRQINEEPESLTGTGDGCSPAVERVIFKALRKNPAERYQSISDLLTDFQMATSGKERQTITLQMKDALKKSGQERIPSDKNTVPIQKPRLLGHNFEVNIAVAACLAAAVIGLSAFISGRMFEVAGETQEVNMWADRNLDGDRARSKGSFAEAEKSYQ